MPSDDIFSGIIGLFIVIIFLVVVLPALAEATGSDMTLGIILFVILAFGIIGAIITSILKR